MPSSTSRRASHEPRRLAALWAGVLAGPVLFLALLETNYVLSYAACEHRHVWMVHLASAVAFVLVGIAGIVAWRSTSSGTTEVPTIDEPAIGELRERFMARAGVALCLGLMLAIIAMEIPAVVLPPCG